MNTSTRTFGALTISLLLCLPLLTHSPQALADNARVSIGHDTLLSADQQADNVVSVFGSSTSEGMVTENVVSVVGDTRVTGPVGENAVAVLGSTYVNSAVNGNVVAVLGDIELGPQANVGGDLVSVGGTVTRDPAAVTHGQIQNVTIGHMNFKWMRAWVTHCLVYGRPLALSADLGWAWTIAFVFLALYLLMALLFPKAMDRCALTMETWPGRSALAAILGILLVPVVITLLCITVIGIIAVPFVGIALFLAGLFGKAAMLAWIGRRILRPNPGALGHPLLAVLIGGLIVMALYLIPVLGFLIYKLLGFMGLGVVFYTLILDRREARAARPKAPPPAAKATASQPAASQPSASQPMAAPLPTMAAEPVPSASAETAAEAEAASTAAGATTAPEPVDTVLPAGTLPRAGFWIRMAALGIDLLLIGVVLYFLGTHDGPFNPGHRAFLLLLAVYGAVMWKMRSTTVGGIVCKLQVQRTDGQPLDWGTVAVRALGCFLSLAVAGLGFIWIAFDSEHQSWHDKLAGTVVVQLPQQQSLF